MKMYSQGVITQTSQPFGEGTKRQRLIRAIKAQGAKGLTCDEAELLFGWSHQSCSPIFTHLAKEGEIKKAQEIVAIDPAKGTTLMATVTRKTRYGSKAVAWTV